MASSLGAVSSGSSGVGLSPAGHTGLCSWVRYFTLTVPLISQVYKWVLTTGNYNLRGNCNGLACYLVGSRKYFVPQKLGISWPDVPLVSYADLTIPYLGGKLVHCWVTLQITICKREAL